MCGFVPLSLIKGAPIRSAQSCTVIFRPSVRNCGDPTNSNPHATNIDIDDGLMARAQEANGKGTKKATVEKALRILIRLPGQEEILKLAGKVRWVGNLDENPAWPLPIPRLVTTIIPGRHAARHHRHAKRAADGERADPVRSSARPVFRA